MSRCASQAPVSYSCHEGVCGSCELRYLDGEHGDAIGAAEGRLHSRVSRCLPYRLVLDP